MAAALLALCSVQPSLEGERIILTRRSVSYLCACLENGREREEDADIGFPTVKLKT